MSSPADLAIVRMRRVATEIDILRARLAADMDAIFVLGGFTAVEACVQAERERIAKAYPKVLASEGFIA